LGNNSSKTSNCAKVKFVVYALIKVKTITFLIANRFYSLVFTSLKATYDSHVQMAEKIMYSLKVKKSEKAG
jgi:hypothetical protein